MNVLSKFMTDAAAATSHLSPASSSDPRDRLGETIAAGWQKATEALSAFGEWIGSFFAKEVLSEEQKAEWETAGHDAATRMIEAIKSVFSGIVEWAAGIGAQISAACWTVLPID